MTARALRPRIAVVDSSPPFLELMEAILGDEGGYQVITILAPDASVDRIAAEEPDLLILDLRMTVGEEEVAGWKLAESVRRHSALTGLPILFCSADVREARARFARIRDMEGTELLLKPFDLEMLLEVTARLLRREPPSRPRPRPAWRAVLVTDADRVVDASGDLELALGYQREELIGRIAAEIAAVEEEVRVAEVARFYEEGSWYGVGRLQRKDGTVLHATVRATREQIGAEVLNVATITPLPVAASR